MNGGEPAPIFSPVIDPRDSAIAHERALTSELGGAKRILLGHRAMWMADFHPVLEAEFGKQGYNVSKSGPPAEERSIFEMNRVRDLLKVETRPIEEGILHMVYDAIERGDLHKTDKYTGHRFLKD